MLGLDPSIAFRRFSGLRFAPPENDGAVVYTHSPRAASPAWRSAAMLPA
jgi:hypothetical protein